MAGGKQNTQTKAAARRWCGGGGKVWRLDENFPRLSALLSFNIKNKLIHSCCPWAARERSTRIRKFSSSTCAVAVAVFGRWELEKNISNRGNYIQQRSNNRRLMILPIIFTNKNQYSNECEHWLCGGGGKGARHWCIYCSNCLYTTNNWC